MLATGKIRNYQLVVGGCQMMNLPVSYIALRLGAIPEMVFIVAIAISQLCLATRLFMLRKLIGLKARDFIKRVYINVIVVTILSAVIPFILANTFEDDIWSFIMLCAVAISSTLLVEFYVGSTAKERQFVISNIKTIIRKKYDKNKQSC
jgi:hypothetical protein